MRNEEEPPDLISIPLPPQGRCGEERSRKNVPVSATVTRRRRRDALESFAVGLCAQGVLVLLLSLVILEIDAPVAEALLRVEAVKPEPDRGDRSDEKRAGGASAPPAPVPEPEKTDGADPPILAPLEVRVPRLATPQLLSVASPIAIRQPSVSPDQLKKDERARKKAAQEWFEQERDRAAAQAAPVKAASSGESYMTLNEEGGRHLFGGQDLGSGGGMVLFLDVSSSMDEFSSAVSRYANGRFPDARAVEVRGCAMRSRSDEWIREFLRHAPGDAVRDIYLVCDLRDGEGAEGIWLMRELLRGAPVPKSLHVISFRELPGVRLRTLLRECDGSFVRANPDKVLRVIW